MPCKVVMLLIEVCVVSPKYSLQKSSYLNISIIITSPLTIPLIWSNINHTSNCIKPFNIRKCRRYRTVALCCIVKKSLHTHIQLHFTSWRLNQAVSPPVCILSSWLRGDCVTLTLSLLSGHPIPHLPCDLPKEVLCHSKLSLATATTMNLLLTAGM